MIQMTKHAFYIQESKESQYNPADLTIIIQSHKNNNRWILWGTVITIWGQQGHNNINKGYNYNSNGVITSIIGTQHAPLLQKKCFPQHLSSSGCFCIKFSSSHVESLADKFLHLIRYSEIDRFHSCRVLVSVTASGSNISFPSSSSSGNIV